MGGLLSSLFGWNTTKPVTSAPTDTPIPTAAPFATIASTTSPAPWAPAKPAWQSLRSGIGSGQCLNNQSKVVQCDGSSGQNWFLDPVSQLLVNQGSNQCLTVGAATNSTPITLSACDPSNVNQQWTQPKLGSLLLKSNANLSLDVPGGQAVNPVSTWFVNGASAQNWTFQ